MNRSYNKIRHIKESNLILEQRKLQETSLTQGNIDIQTILNGLLIFVKLMISNIPYVRLALILKWLYNNKDKNVADEMKKVVDEIKKYSEKIDAELEKEGLRFKTQDVLNNLLKLKNNIYTQLEKEYNEMKNKINPLSF